jgi:hypothetical protein
MGVVTDVILADGDRLRRYRNLAVDLFLRPWPAGARSLFSLPPRSRWMSAPRIGG